MPYIKGINTKIKSLFYPHHHNLWGGFYILHPSELIAQEKGKYVVTWGLGELGLRAVKNGTNYIYPFIIDSVFKENSWSLKATIQAFGVSETTPISSSTVTLSNTSHQHFFELPPFIQLKITIENVLSIPITESTVKPIFIYTA